MNKKGARESYDVLAGSATKFSICSGVYTVLQSCLSPSSRLNKEQEHIGLYYQTAEWVAVMEISSPPSQQIQHFTDVPRAEMKKAESTNPRCY